MSYLKNKRQKSCLFSLLIDFQMGVLMLRILWAEAEQSADNQTGGAGERELRGVGGVRRWWL